MSDPGRRGREKLRIPEANYGTVMITYEVTDGMVPIAKAHLSFDNLLFEELEFIRQLLNQKFLEVEEARSGFRRELLKRAEAEQHGHS